MTSLLFDKIISDRKNLERILDNLKEGIIAHDLNRRIFFFNQEAARITGFTKNDVLGRDCHEVFDGPFCGGHCSFCQEAPALIENDEYSVNITSQSGEPRRIEMRVTKMNDENGTFFGVLTSFKDVTDLMQLRMRAGKLSSFANIIGRDIKMLQLFKQINDVAGYDYPVHIYGETGTGKELVACAIHNESLRGGAPFVPINCGALPENLIETELFGHVKGAFSGAVRDKKGRFELADGGTIFLDEISELSKHMQVKLLRFLQEGTFERVGGEVTIRVKARVISASNKDLKKETQRNNFRDDLYYRINVIPIILPPLRERKNDIPILIEHFLQQAGERYGHEKLHVSQDALALMLDYRWPGNVRELQNALQFAIVKCRTKVILPNDLPMEIKDSTKIRSRTGPLRKLEIDAVKVALEKCAGNKTRAAKLLGIGRATLYRFLSAHPDIT